MLTIPSPLTTWIPDRGPIPPSDLEPWAHLSSPAWLLHLALIGLLCAYKAVVPRHQQSATPSYFLLVTWLSGLLMWVWRLDSDMRSEAFQASLEFKLWRLRSALAPSTAPVAGTARSRPTHRARDGTDEGGGGGGANGQSDAGNEAGRDGQEEEEKAAAAGDGDREANELCTTRELWTFFGEESEYTSCT